MDKIILVVEDSEVEFEIVKRCLKKADFVLPLVRCKDGEDALDYLYQRNKYNTESTRPSLVFLDLNLPKISGHQVLEKIKQDEDLRSIPVIVLTNSKNMIDIDKCYDSLANTCIHKSVDLGQFMESITHIKKYWLETALLPTS